MQPVHLFALFVASRTGVWQFGLVAPPRRSLAALVCGPTGWGSAAFCCALVQWGSAAAFICLHCGAQRKEGVASAGRGSPLPRLSLAPAASSARHAGGAELCWCGAWQHRAIEVL